MEPNTAFFLIIAVTGLVCAMICSSIAERKGRSGGGWFLLGLFFGPLAVLVVAATSSEAHDSVSDETVQPAERSQTLTNELTMLAELHQRGALTEDEFAAAKARLLT